MNPLGAAAHASARSTLSDGCLLARLVKLRGTEREVQRRIVAYLAEVERRRLYLSRGYGSLFEFCIDYLKYSRSSAARRIGAARCIARFPRMARLFERGEIDLTVLSAISGVMTRENCAEIAAWLPGRSLREIEAFAGRRQPERALRDQIRQIYVTRVKSESELATDPVRSSEGVSPAPGDGVECTVHRTFSPSAGTKTAQPADNKSLKNQGVRAVLGDGGGGDSGGDAAASAPDAPNTAPGVSSSGATASADAAPATRVVIERKFKIQFAVDPAFIEKYKKVLSLLSTKYPRSITFETLFDILMTDYLDRHNPESKMKRREKRRENKNKHTRKSDPKKVKKQSSAERTRHIPQEIRDQVFVRDGGRCTYIGPNGRRCGETRYLEIDHIIPYAKGGSNSPENLRLLCAEHNRLAAEKEFGREHIERFYRRE